MSCCSGNLITEGGTLDDFMDIRSYFESVNIINQEQISWFKRQINCKIEGDLSVTW